MPGPVAIVGFAALGLLVVGWLVVSFTRPGRRRALLEWLSASSLYVALVCLFLHLTLRARDEGSTGAFWAFVVLLVFFGGGLLVSIAHAVGAARGDGKTQSSATN